MTAMRTPGRWVGRSCHVETEAGEVVADVYAPSGGHAQREANRDLIAAAPALHEALLNLVHALHRESRGDDVSPKVRPALASARQVLDRLGARIAPTIEEVRRRMLDDGDATSCPGCGYLIDGNDLDGAPCPDCQAGRVVCHGCGWPRGGAVTARALVLWGFHPAHGNIPRKLEEHSAAARAAYLNHARKVIR